MKGHPKIVRTLILGLICVGCSSSAHFNRKDGMTREVPETGKYGLSRPPILSTGSTFTYQDLSLSGGQFSRVTMEVKERKQFEHKEAYWIAVTEKEMTYFNIYDMNLNWIGMVGEGRRLESVEPCFEIFRWPLGIGKKWNTKYTLRDYSDYSHDVQIHKFKVHANIQNYEEVRVPAGAFKALRIQANGETFWYAPSIGWIVREELGVDNRDRRILELVQYRIPTNP